MRSRSQRSRRRQRAPTSTPEPERRRALLRGGDAAAAALLVLVVSVVVVAALLLSRGGTSQEGATTGDGAATPGTSPATAGDQQAIESLARRSIEVLPAGEWPSLYDSFTGEFRQRCPRQEFDQAGKEAANQLGDDLQRLRFRRLESVTIEGATASAIVVGEVAGGSEYKIQAAFQKEDGDWKIAPAPDTQGCAAFARLSG